MENFDTELKQEFVGKLKALQVKSATSILEIGKILVEAKDQLHAASFSDFLAETKYKEGSSALRKWTCIGQAYLRLLPIVDRLPSCWSTIYKIASLRSDQFDALVDDEILNPNVTAREISEALGLGSKVTDVTITLIFDKTIDQESLKAIYTEISGLVPISMCTIKLTEDANAMLKAAANDESMSEAA